VADQDAYANLVLPGLLRDRRVAGRDAAFATELAYGTLRLRGRYDAVLAACVDRPLDALDPGLLDALRLGVHQLLGMRVPPHAAVGETVALVRQNLGGGPGALANAVLRKVAARDVDAWVEQVAPAADTELLAHLAIAESHPLWVVRALREALAARDGGTTALDDELRALLSADNTAPDVTLVARPGLVTVDDLLAAGGTPGRWSPVAVRLAAGDPGRLAAVRDGRAGVQDEGSQLVALALAAAPVLPAAGQERPERWLDLCAGPGGKSGLLGAVVRQRGGTLVAVEQAPHRADLVRTAVAALGDTVEVRCTDGRGVGDAEPAAYDRVLVDAPCTMWPPSRAPTGMAFSMFTRVPTCTAPRADTSRVCFMTSASNVSDVEPTTVRHTPLTAMDSPCTASDAAFGARTVRRQPSPDGAMAAISPISSMIPVNISFLPIRR
jgi:16S rRNA (cytosine967-C5)-methyltransferase